MTLSALERRELLTFAATFEAFAGNPEMVTRFAETMRAWVEGRTGRTEEVLGAAPVQLELAPATAHQSLTPAPSSSSSDRSLNDQEKKTVPRGVRPNPGDPLPDDFRAAYLEVVRERGVMLPSADYLWTKFVDHLHEHDVTFTRWSSVKRKWRDSWCWHEKPIPEVPIAAISPPVEKPTPAKKPARPHVQSDDLLEERERQVAATASLEEARARARIALMSLDGVATPSELRPTTKALLEPPEPRAMSA